MRRSSASPHRPSHTPEHTAPTPGCVFACGGAGFTGRCWCCGSSACVSCAVVVLLQVLLQVPPVTRLPQRSAACCTPWVQLAWSRLLMCTTALSRLPSKSSQLGGVASLWGLVQGGREVAVMSGVGGGLMHGFFAPTRLAAGLVVFSAAAPSLPGLCSTSLLMPPPSTSSTSTGLRQARQHRRVCRWPRTCWTVSETASVVAP